MPAVLARNSTTMRTLGYFAVVILLAFAPAALADSVQFTINSSVQVSGGSPNDNYWGDYSTAPDAYGTRTSVNANVPSALGESTFSNISFFLPAGSVVTSATMNLILPVGPITGTGSLSIAPETLPPPDPNGIHFAPTFDSETSIFSILDVSLQSAGSSSIADGNFFPNSPIINGNEVSTGTWYLDFLLHGEVIGTINTPAYNWDGYIEGDGQATLPYSVQIDVDYTVVPEPPTFIFFGTAIAMAGFLYLGRHKRSGSLAI